MGDLSELSTQLLAFAGTERGGRFMGWPTRWWERPHWRCLGGHVAQEIRIGPNGPSCVTCSTSAHLTFPEDLDGPLSHYLFMATKPFVLSLEDERKLAALLEGGS